jgi:hypothetical protein
MKAERRQIVRCASIPPDVSRTQTARRRAERGGLKGSVRVRLSHPECAPVMHAGWLGARAGRSCVTAPMLRRADRRRRPRSRPLQRPRIRDASRLVPLRVARPHPVTSNQWTRSAAQQAALQHVDHVTRSVDAAHSADSEHARALWRVLRAETSCNFHWGEASVHRCRTTSTAP